MKKILPLFITTSICMVTHTYAQLFIDSSIPVEDMVIYFFDTPEECITISNVTYSGCESGIGFFEASDTELGELGLNAGILLTNGSVGNAVGPNDESGASEACFPPLDPEASDTDLDALIPGFSTNDATIIEFDIVSIEPFLELIYSFGSEEYNEYVCSSFNDVFGFFVSGPGFDGPYSNNAENIAVVPDTTVAVSINTINNGESGFGTTACDVVFPEYYIDNEGNVESDIQYDGYTTALFAAFSVEPGETYHIKLVIADAGDSILDSGVFLGVQSLCGGFLVNPVVEDVTFSVEEVPAPAEGGMDERSWLFTFNSFAKYGTSWVLDYGDGTVATERYPEPHVYTAPGTYTVTHNVSNWCCETINTYEVVVGAPTNIQQTAQQPLQIYPNPSTGVVFIETHAFSNNSNLQVFNVTGQLVFQQENIGSQDIRLDLGQWGKGLYFIQLMDSNNKVYNQRVSVL